MCSQCFNRKIMVLVKALEFMFCDLLFTRHTRGSQISVCGQFQQPGESVLVPQWLHLYLQLLQGKHPSPVPQGQQKEVPLQPCRNGKDEDEQDAVDVSGECLNDLNCFYLSSIFLKKKHHVIFYIENMVCIFYFTNQQFF